MREESSNQQSNNVAEHGSDELKRLKFQNYTPRTEELKKYCEEEIEPDATLQQISDSQSEMLREASMKFGDPALDLDNMVPRQGNWDMQQSLAPKLERLEQRTRRAIIEIVRQRRVDEGKLGIERDDRSISSVESQ